MMQQLKEQVWIVCRAVILLTALYTVMCTVHCMLQDMQLLMLLQMCRMHKIWFDWYILALPSQYTQLVVLQKTGRTQHQCTKCQQKQLQPFRVVYTFCKVEKAVDAIRGRSHTAKLVWKGPVILQQWLILVAKPWPVSTSLAFVPQDSLHCSKPCRSLHLRHAPDTFCKSMNSQRPIIGSSQHIHCCSPLLIT